MNTNYNSYYLNTLYLENIKNYIIINEEMYKSIMSSIQYNYLLILFTMSCFVGILCSYKKPKHDYKLIQNAIPIKTELIDKV